MGIAATFLVWTFARVKPVYSWKLVAVCGVVFLFNELHALLLRRRKGEFAAAARAYEQMLARPHR